MLLGEVLEEPPIEPLPVVPVLPPVPTEPLELPPMPVLAPPVVPGVLGEVVLELEPELLVPCFASQSVRAAPVSRVQSCCVVELVPLEEDEGLTVVLEPAGLVVVVVVESDGLDELPAEDDGVVVVVVDGDVVVVVLDEPLLMPVLPDAPELELCARA